MSKQSEKLLSDAEIADLADKLIKEIQDAGGMKQYYDGLFGSGAYDRDLAGFVQSNDTVH